MPKILYQEPFSSYVTSDITLIQDSDTEVNFIDYSNFNLGASTFSLPEASNQIMGSKPTRRILIRANVFNPAQSAAVNILAGTTPMTFTGDYHLRFDAYL